MTKPIFILLAIFSGMLPQPAIAQEKTTTSSSPHFTGAGSTRQEYKALYVLNTDVTPPLQIPV